MTREELDKGFRDGTIDLDAAVKGGLEGDYGDLPGGAFLHSIHEAVRSARANAEEVFYAEPDGVEGYRFSAIARELPAWGNQRPVMYVILFSRGSDTFRVIANLAAGVRAAGASVDELLGSIRRAQFFPANDEPDSLGIYMAGVSVLPGSRR